MLYYNVLEYLNVCLPLCHIILARTRIRLPTYKLKFYFQLTLFKNHPLQIIQFIFYQLYQTTKKRIKVKHKKVKLLTWKKIRQCINFHIPTENPKTEVVIKFEDACSHWIKSSAKNDAEDLNLTVITLILISINYHFTKLFDFTNNDEQGFHGLTLTRSGLGTVRRTARWPRYSYLSEGGLQP